MLQRGASLALAALIAAASLSAGAAPTLFKWIDANGKVQYSDKAPTGFKGEVTRIETDEQPAQAAPRIPAPPAPAPGAKAPDVAAPPPEDMSTKRRNTRAQLEARLAKARDGVAAAKKALADSESPDVDERQIVQQRATSGGMHGMTGRSNCRQEKYANGQTALMCPTFVPTPEYHERVARLEEDLRRAEEDLSAAELAWRRGVD